MSTSINSQNNATKYKSGDEFYFTYAMQQYLSPTFAFGIGGYYYKQVSDDRQNGVVVNTNRSVFPFDPLNEGAGNRGETFAIGPVVSYNYSHDLVFQGHWDHEVLAYNRLLRRRALSPGGGAFLSDFGSGGLGRVRVQGFRLAWPGPASLR